MKVNPSGVVILRANVQGVRPVPQRFAPITPVDDNRITYTPYVPQSTARTPVQRNPDPGFVDTRAPLTNFLPRARAPLLQPISAEDADYQPGQSTARPQIVRQQAEYNQISQQRRESIPLPPDNFLPVQRQDVNYVPQPTAGVPVSRRVDPFQAYRVQQFQ